MKNAEEKEEGGEEGSNGIRSIEAVLSFFLFVLIKNYLVLCTKALLRRKGVRRLVTTTTRTVMEKS